MDDLIEYLRDVSENANLPLTMWVMLAQAADALEAAREDTERLDALEELVAEQRDKTLMLHHGRDPSSYAYAGLGLSNTGRTLRQAIDQARRKNET